MISDFRWSRASMALLVTSLIALAFTCASASASPSPGSLATETFTFTGSPQSYAVPADVGTISSSVLGANGGAGGVGHRVSVPTVALKTSAPNQVGPSVALAPGGGSPSYGEPTSGGLGGRAQAALAVKEGETLTIEVGGVGVSGTDSESVTAGARPVVTIGGGSGEPEPNAGGYRSGADGGTAANPDSGGGGGGGSSEILSGATPLLVAGGGGGGGGTYLGRCGNGAGEEIGDGGNGGENETPGDGEDGATASEYEEIHDEVVVAGVVTPLIEPAPEGGEGGFGGSTEHPGGPSGLGLPGGSGEFNGGGGGGGGGGYYGGSGGAFGACGQGGAITGGGGGGGSDYAAPQSSSVSFARAANTSEEGNGQVQISYYVPYPTSTQANPSPSTTSVGEPITISATVSAPSGANCPGTVQFEIDGKPVGSPVIVHDGTAETTTTAPTAGNHPITATYSGTPSNASEAGCLPSTSTPATLSVLYPTSTQASPSPPTANVGETIAITATVTAAVNCAGTVQFEIDGKPIGAPVVLENGSAHMTITAPVAGDHPISATYSGSPSTSTQAGCEPSSSAPSTLTINAPTPAASISPVVSAEAVVPAKKALACASARRFLIHLLIPKRQRLLGASVYVDGKLVKRLSPDTRSYLLNLRGHPFATVTITLTAREADGHTITGNRIYHTCRPYRLPGHTKFKI